VSRLFVFPHEAAIAVNVGAEYGGELAFHHTLPNEQIFLRDAASCQSGDRTLIRQL